jgi:hypothetical protein
MFELSPEPKQLEIVDSSLHSSQLVDAYPDESVSDARADVSEYTRQLIVAFIEEHA